VEDSRRARTSAAEVLCPFSMRWGEGEQLEDEVDGEEGLEGDGEAPLDGIFCEGEFKVEPIRNV
jgi:hypothetical protein